MKQLILHLWPKWSDCAATGYPSARPAWMAVWLMIAADNAIHLAINYAAPEVAMAHVPTDDPPPLLVRRLRSPGKEHVAKCEEVRVMPEGGAMSYCIVSDDDGHDYVIPVDNKDLRGAFVAVAAVAEEPDWAIRINGPISTVTFPYFEMEL